MTRIEELEQKLNEMNEGLEFGIKEFQKQITNFNNDLRIAKEDFLDELNECQKALAELKESKKEGKWKPTYGDEYWLRDDWGNFRTCEYCAGDCMDWRLKNVPLFPTKEECERYWHFMDTVKEKSYEFSKEEWENENISKHLIYYDFESKEFIAYRTIISKYFGEIYFKTEADAQYIIDNFKDELTEWFL